jgi:hypothetical protein
VKENFEEPSRQRRGFQESKIGVEVILEIPNLFTGKDDIDLDVVAGDVWDEVTKWDDKYAAGRVSQLGRIWVFGPQNKLTG